MLKKENEKGDTGKTCSEKPLGAYFSQGLALKALWGPPFNLLTGASANRY